jgi:hypothetical protein
VTDTLPSDVQYLGNLWASDGDYDEADGVVTWTGSLPAGRPVVVTFGVVITDQITSPKVLDTVTQWDDGLGNVWQRSTVVIVRGRAVYLPLIERK